MSTDTRNLTAPDLAGVADWFKSSYSGNGTNCVEAADLTQTTYSGIAIRDSKDPRGPALLLAPNQFATFISHLRAGHYDN